MEEKNVEDHKISFSCPVCAHKTDYPVTHLMEGAILSCPFCKLTLKLHGHMWQDVLKEIRKVTGKA